MLMKLLFENQQTDANFSLGMMLANFTPTRYVSPCRRGSVHVGISIQRRVGLPLVKTRPNLIIFWSIKTRMKNWKLPNYKRIEANWLFRCWWDVSSMQHFFTFWSNGQLSWLLSLSRSTSFSHWRRYRMWLQEKRARWNEMELYPEKRLHSHWIVGLWVVKTLEDN